MRSKGTLRVKLLEGLKARQVPLLLLFLVGEVMRAHLFLRSCLPRAALRDGRDSVEFKEKLGIEAGSQSELLRAYQVVVRT